MEEYKRLFDVYLRMAVRLYDPQRPYDNLEVCCRQCIRCLLYTSLSHLSRASEARQSIILPLNCSMISLKRPDM